MHWTALPNRSGVCKPFLKGEPVDCTARSQEAHKRLNNEREESHLQFFLDLVFWGSPLFAPLMFLSFPWFLWSLLIQHNSLFVAVRVVFVVFVISILFVKSDPHANHRLSTTFGHDSMFLGCPAICRTQAWGGGFNVWEVGPLQGEHWPQGGTGAGVS